METPQSNAGNELPEPGDRTLLKRSDPRRDDIGSTASMGQMADFPLGLVSRGPGIDKPVVADLGPLDDLVDDAGPHPTSEEGKSLGGSSAYADDADEKAKTVIRRTDAGSSVRNAGNTPAATPAEVARVLLGSRLSHFELEELIGGGGMGAVFRARDERLDRTVAIKVIPFIGDDPDMQRRFRNEAQSAARLDHPNIARVFDVGMFEGWRYIVFEYIEGTNLRDLVSQEGVLSIDDAVFYTRQIAEALHHASGRGVVHRDVKPSNVLVNTDGDTKLVDMGLARSDQLDMSGDMTASGVTLGTFDYISPEQARDPRDADVRSDIYSLGCTLYFMLTGSPPYPGGTMLQKLLNHGNAPPPDPSGLRGGISDDLKAIIHKMLAKSPDARYQRAIDLVADLRELAAREGLVRAQAQGTLTINRDELAVGGLATHLPWLTAASMLIIGGVVLQVVASLRDSAFVLENPPSAVTMRQVSSDDLNEMTRLDDVKSIIPGNSASLGAGRAIDPTGVNPVDSEPAIAINSERSADATLDGTSPEMSPASDGKTTANDGVADAADVASLPPRYSEFAIPRDSGAAMEAITPGTVPAVKIERIVVGSSEQTPTVANASTLVDAIQMADELGVKTIELAQEVIESPPIRIPNDGMTIRSIVGSTEIRFITGPIPAMQRAVMIDIGSNRVDFQNLHLNWNVRSASIDGGALLSVSDNRLVRLTDCTITIENLTQREEVFAFEITSLLTDRPEISLMTQDPLSLRIGADSAGSARDVETSPLVGTTSSQPRVPVPPLVAIEMNHVAVRGEMTLVNVVDPVQLQLRWDNGLLAVSRRMMEVAGVNVLPAAAGNQIQLVLNRVTMWTGEGLVRTRLGPSGVYPMLIDRDSRNGVYRSSTNSPHIEFSGLDPAYENPDQLVNLRGEDNAYDYQPESDWPLLLSTSGGGQRQVYWMSQMISSQRPTWIGERSTRWVVRWSEPIDDSLPASRVRASQFFQDGTVVSGFDRTLLPDFPPDPAENSGASQEPTVDED
jgi:serine/threonine-protein kinase